jgi:hypothetical protein
MTVAASKGNEWNLASAADKNKDLKGHHKRMQQLNDNAELGVGEVPVQRLAKQLPVFGLNITIGLVADRDQPGQVDGVIDFLTPGFTRPPTTLGN